MATKEKSQSMGPVSKRASIPPVFVDRVCRTPLHQQISAQLAEAIRDGKLSRGARLPSTRTLAAMLGVSRNTVLMAYEALTADDLIRNSPGSRARVNNSAPVKLPAITRVLRDAGYPECMTLICDPDGNPLYLRHDGHSHS